MPSVRPAASASQARITRRRRISPAAGHALEKLGHAIEYLTDEFVHSGADFNGRNEQLAAVRILMALNREVYFACPEIPTIGERFQGLLGRHAH